jgi:hypothetical protein
MATLRLNPQLLSHFRFVEGQTPEVKMLSLLETYLAVQIRACEQEISAYEVKYRATFSEFAEAWQQDRIAHRYDHAIERDYMEWEGLTAEKQRWLERLRGLPQRETVEVMMA